MEKHYLKYTWNNFLSLLKHTNENRERLLQKLRKNAEGIKDKLVSGLILPVINQKSAVSLKKKDSRKDAMPNSMDQDQFMWI